MKTRITLAIAICMVALTIVRTQPIFPLEGYEDNPTLTVTSGSWETGGLMFPFIYYEDSTFYLLYTGGEFSTGPTSIGLATSTDGYNFTKLEDPIFEGDGSGIDAYSVAFPVVFKKEGTYYLFYVGASGPGLCSEGVIMQAMASNIQGPYERLADPIMEPGSAGEWDAAGIVPDRVFDSDSGLVMYFGGSSSFVPEREGLAYFNGSEWIKYDDPSTTNHPFAESDPILGYGTPPDWDSWCASFIDVNPITTGWEMFYQGSYNGNWKIGYATSIDGMEWIKKEDPVYSWADDLFAQMWGFTITASPTIVVVNNKYFIYYDYGDGYDYLGMATAWSIHALDVIAEPADNIGGYGYTANWQASEIATGYLLDVSTQEDFGSFISGYENFDVGDISSYEVSQLNLNTMYYYRLRAYMETDTGFYSNTVSTTTLITGFSYTLEDEIAIYTSGSDIYINLSGKNNPEANARIYTLSGRLLGSYSLVEGMNTIPLQVEKQAIIIKIQVGNQTFTKKVLVW